eukprot:1619066-Amphidinium_carterae.1
MFVVCLDHASLVVWLGALLKRVIGRGPSREQTSAWRNVLLDAFETRKEVASCHDNSEAQLQTASRLHILVLRLGFAECADSVPAERSRSPRPEKKEKPTEGRKLSAMESLRLEHE